MQIASGMKNILKHKQSNSEGFIFNGINMKMLLQKYVYTYFNI